jgi:hypothetical protein
MKHGFRKRLSPPRETPWDLYQAIERRMGCGELTFTRRGDEYLFMWYVSGRFAFGFNLAISAMELARTPAQWIAERFNAAARRSMEKQIEVKRTFN